MGLERFRTLLALPVASLFLILLVCVFAIQRPPSTGIRITLMKVRSTPLTNCEFNGFTVYLRSDGKVAGGDRDGVVSKETMLSRIKEARENIQDETIFVISDPDVQYGRLVEMISDIQHAAPPDHIAVVTREGQVTMFNRPSGEPVKVTGRSMSIRVASHKRTGEMGRSRAYSAARG